MLENAGASLRPVSVPAHLTASLAILPLFLEGAKLGYDTNLGGAFAKVVLPRFPHGDVRSCQAQPQPRASPELQAAGPLRDLRQQRFNGRLYAKAQNARPAIVRQYLGAFADVDLLAMPTVAVRSHRYEMAKDYVEAIDRTLFGGERAMTSE